MKTLEVTKKLGVSFRQSEATRNLILNPVLINFSTLSVFTALR